MERPGRLPWPMFQHDARHTGYNPNAPAYDNPGRLKWKTYLGGRVSDSVPVLGKNNNNYLIFFFDYRIILNW